MFFVASKIFWMFASPVVLLLVAALAAVLCSAVRSAPAWRAVAIAAIVLIGALAATPMGLRIIAPLEDRFPQPPADMPPPDGIIVLGGVIRDAESAARGQTVFSEGERVVQAAILAKRYPHARVIFTGGNGSLLAANSSEAQEAQKLLVELGLDPSRITLEAASRNTDENARFTAALLHPQPNQRWLLVTSAYHMPRSIGLFEKAGFKVTAFPVAFRTLGEGRGPQWETDPARNLETFELAAHEWIGLVAYRATGRIDQLFPGPGRAGSAEPGPPAKPAEAVAPAPKVIDPCPFDGGRAQAIDAAKVGRIDGPALAIDDEPAFQCELDRPAPNLAQMRTPAEFILAARCGEGLRRLDRTDGAALRRPRAKIRDDRLRLGV